MPARRSVATGRVASKHHLVKTDELDYDLDPSLIATEPVTPRDAAKLMVVSRSDPDRVEHRVVSDLPSLLEPRDLLVFNVSGVVPARFQGRRLDTAGRVQGLYLRDGPERGSWIVLLKARRFRSGARVSLDARGGEESGVVLTLGHRVDDPSEPGAWVVRVGDDAGRPVSDALERVGLTPLPPYILAARRRTGRAVSDEFDRERYQTVYARGTMAGSIAAPTAGLHFTPELLDRLGAAGVERGEAVLHIGPGTFRPVETDRLEDHAMHAERCSVMPDTERSIAARLSGETPGRILAVGTTTARSLEAHAQSCDSVGSGRWIQAELMIAPGYRWQWVQGMMTNFHLPRSTLMAMVGAMLPGGVEQLKGLYAKAIEHRYRFYSYGDAMLILP